MLVLIPSPSLSALRCVDGCPDALLDMAPTRREQPLVSSTVAKHIVGQSVFQLVVLGTLVFGGPEVRHFVGAPDDVTLNTLVFNTFVVMQLFNQVRQQQAWGELGGGRTRTLTCWVSAEVA